MSRDRQIQRGRKWVGGCQRQMWVEGMIAKGYGVLSEVMKIF
jgi:hypothetical protein